MLVQLVTGQTPELAERAKSLLEKTSKKNQRCSLPDAALIELMYVLEKVKRLPRSDIAAVISMLSVQKVLDFNRTLFDELLPQYAAHPALSIHDCYLAACARLENAEPLWTFDRKLANQIPQATLVP